MAAITKAEQTRRRKADAAASGKQRRNRRLLAEVHEEARQSVRGMHPSVDPADAITEILSNYMAMYRYATMKTITLTEEEYWRDTLGGPIPNEWIREQERLGMQVVHIAGKAAAMGVAERQVRIQEAQAVIFATVVDAALKELGLQDDQRRRVHELVATKLEDIEGTASALPSALVVGE